VLDALRNQCLLQSLDVDSPRPRHLPVPLFHAFTQAGVPVHPCAGVWRIGSPLFYSSSRTMRAPSASAFNFILATILGRLRRPQSVVR
jgi:hypothetical protein